MIAHDLIKHRPGQYECRTCMQTWPRKPGANCPGLKVYPKNDHAPLITRGQLGHYGYRTAEKALPPPVGCYHSGPFGSYVLLYDPSQALKGRSRPPITECPDVKVYEKHNYVPLVTQKDLAYLGYQTSAKAMPSEVGCYYDYWSSRYTYLYDPIQAHPKTYRRGIPNPITEILWPLRYVSLLEELCERHLWPFFSVAENEKSARLYNEMNNIAALTGVFTRAEIEQMSGNVLELKIPPAILYRFYPTNRGNWKEATKLRTNLLIAYRRHIALSQSLS